jgi:hypothetical protein
VFGGSQRGSRKFMESCGGLFEEGETKRDERFVFVCLVVLFEYVSLLEFKR